ncbi:hypothetical protein [Cognatiyoonia sp. IB215182]|uniref:hypothetical protein n=1 Tax=Cognatiyoonia sp. IB215182 TaxID=3097353 RepID=UPI002A0C3B08|nr:hypothetical protein [Cognatiyoonia sp. IB215182]MDX8351927.1 hypothetical protein [Cognatiyoonia sp. IB215182]
MAELLYCYALRRVTPLLDEEEWSVLKPHLDNRLNEIKEYREQHHCSISEAAAKSSASSLRVYEQLTGARLDHPDQLWRVRRTQYGPVCTQCGKPLRTPRAKFCAECGCLRDGDIQVS